MTRTLGYGRAASAAVVAVAVGCVAVPAGAAPSGTHHSSARAALAARAGGRATFAEHGHGHAATFFGTPPGHPAERPADVAASARPAAAARGWMKHFGSVFGVASPADLHVTGSSSDGAGSIVRMQQTVDGVPVVGGGFSLALDHADNLVSVNGKATDLAAAAAPSVPRSAAAQVARSVVSRDSGVSALHASRPVLSIFDSSLYGVASLTGPATVWSTEVSSADRVVRHRVFVDAVTGAIVLDLDDNSHATTPKPRRVVCRPAAGNDHRIKNPRCKTPNDNSQVKVIATESNPPAKSNKDAYNAFRFAKAVWTFYWKLFGRKSLDDRGMALGSTVHYCPPRGQGPCPYDNAFWDGHEMVYGSGYTTALDVVGHEMTHGVTQHTSNLLSYYQSGAINESMSDTMGELIQQIEGPALGAYDPSKPWRIGENLKIGAVRRMDHPEYFGDPDSMTSSNYSAYPVYSRYWDNGGVHANAGVGNKAAYLVATHVSGSSQLVRDVKTANIYYRLDKMMWSATTYQDLFTLLPQACRGLESQLLPVPGHAATQVKESDCQQVDAAVAATKMDQQPVKAAAVIRAAATPSCDNSGAPTTIRRDLFESNPLSSGLYQQGYSKSRDSHGLKAFGRFWWSNTYINYYGMKPAKYQPRGSKASLYGDDADPTWLDPANMVYDRQDSWVQMASGIPVDSATQVVFKHAWEFDYGPGPNGAIHNFDGGKVYYSLDGGSWHDAASKFVTNGYNGKITSVSGDGTNPLIREPAFVNSSHGWTASKLDLSSLAGHHVRLRWRIGGDRAVGSLGWYIDDVFAYTCAETTTLAANPTSVPAGTQTTLTAQLVHHGAPVDSGESLSLYRRIGGTSAWTLVGSQPIIGGVAQWTDTPDAAAGHTEQYQARFAGDTGIPASRSAVVTVTVT